MNSADDACRVTAAQRLAFPAFRPLAGLLAAPWSCCRRLPASAAKPMTEAAAAPARLAVAAVPDATKLKMAEAHPSADQGRKAVNREGCAVGLPTDTVATAAAAGVMGGSAAADGHPGGVGSIGPDYGLGSTVRGRRRPPTADARGWGSLSRE
mmetsp:Transcript_10840/g.27081  ORF Transcript_10840/g.27081 Transcript_10840/m.27081 type:complete len:153 (-) Transcript_10840:7-465(-)